MTEWVNPYTVTCPFCGRTYKTLDMPAQCAYDDCKFINFHWGFGEGPIFKDGKNRRVQISPSFDLWMRGAMFGEIVSVKDDIYRVRMDANGKIYKFKIQDLQIAH